MAIVHKCTKKPNLRNFISVVGLIPVITFANICYQCHGARRKTSWLVKQEHKGRLRKLQENADLTLRSQDKGAGVVLTNKSNYVAKI